ncbi:MAG: hypothetical protein Q8R12_03080 [bacterium]|nr:hypothetical protein [bacterium]
MTQRILNKTYETRLGLIFLGVILASLVIYIYGLNLAVWEGFQKDRLEKNLKVLRQDLQSRQEFFTSQLSQFYENEASAFVGAEVSKAQFVSRRSNVARAGSALTQ